MKRILLVLILLIAGSGFGQNAGFFGTPLSFVEYNSTLVEADNFNGSNLGTVNSLVLNGSEIRTFKNGGADVTGAFINYRIYEASSTPGSFIEESINFGSDLGDGNQLWETSSLGIDLISGLGAGDYKFEVFFRISTTGCCGGQVFQSNSGANYTADFSLPYRTANNGNWNDTNTWIGGSVPPTGSEIGINHDVILDVDAEVSDITISSGNTLTSESSQGRKLTILDGGTFTNNGMFTANDGSVSFQGAGTIAGTTSTTFNNVDIAGGVDFGSNNSTVNGTLTINAGGFANTNAPTYGASSTLNFDTGGSYTIDGTTTLWVPGNSLSQGVPNNVKVETTNPLNIFGARDVTGNLTINSGASVVQGNNDFIIQGNFENSGTYSFVNNGSNPLTVEGNFNDQSGANFALSNTIGGDLVLKGDFTDNGTFTANGRAVFFTGSGSDQTVTSTTDPLTIDFIVIDKPSNKVQMLQNLNLPNNLELTNGNLDPNGNTLTISGDIRPNAGNGTIEGSTAGSTLVFDNSSTARSLESGDLLNNKIANLTIDESAGVTINTDLTVTENLDINAGENLIQAGKVLKVDGNITNDGNITFKSELDASTTPASSKTAQLNTFTGTISGTGNVTVERFIPAGDNIRRAFRFLASPVNSTNFIRDNWQQGGLNPGDAGYEAGFGTHITGSTTDGFKGFDGTTSGQASLLMFDNAAQTWGAIDNTDNTNLENGKAYNLFVRGDRSIDLTSATQTPTNTTLRATGSLVTGQVDFTTTSTPPLASGNKEWNLIGNPYQSIVDFTALTTTDVKSTFFYSWNPNNNTDGAYELHDNTVSTPSVMIQPGQSFFVQNSTTATSPQITFTEAAKNTSGAITTVFDNNSLAIADLELYDTNNNKLDVMLFRFEAGADNSIDDFDAGKLGNPDENLASNNANTLLALERRDIPQNDEVVPLFVNQYQFTQYEFRLSTANWDENIDVYIVDDYLNTQTLIDDSQVYSFNIDTSIPESVATDRFSLMFDNTTLGVNDNNFGEGFSLYPNPTQDGLFSIKTQNLNAENVQINIHNLMGQQVLKQNYEVESNGDININAGNLSTGVYMVKLQQDKQSYTTKLIIQ